ncbi:peptidylprolyl isomerase [bacterium]|nr:peptidylprolyl isomerase [bacterium]MBU1936308.1 peptidylprolyl isomerase [bacterium]
MPKAKKGDTVKVHYTGKLEDGTVFDSSLDREPLQFKIGENAVIEGFEQMVSGLSTGEKKTQTIPAEQAYGLYSEDLLLQVARKELPTELNPQVGQILEGSKQDGEKVSFKVKAVSEETVTLDANHPLAGKNLVFEIELIEIV